MSVTKIHRAQAVKRLGEKQKEVLRHLLKKCTIQKTQCTSTGETDIVVVDQDGDWLLDVSPRTLESLEKRGLISWQEETMCLQVEAFSYFIDNRYTGAIRSACNINRK